MRASKLLLCLRAFQLPLEQNTVHLVSRMGFAECLGWHLVLLNKQRFATLKRLPCWPLGFFQGTKRLKRLAPPSLPRSPPPSLARSLSLSLSTPLSHSLTLSLCHSVSLSLSHSRTLALSPSLPLSLSHSLTLSLSLSLSYSLNLSLCLSLSHSLTLSLALALALALALSLSLSSFAHSLTHSLSFSFDRFRTNTTTLPKKNACKDAGGRWGAGFILRDGNRRDQLATATLQQAGSIERTDASATIVCCRDAK